MPQEARKEDQPQPPPKIVKATPELMRQLISSGRVDSLTPAVLTLNDLGQKIIRQIVPQTSY